MSYSHLAPDERYQIHALMKGGHFQSEIAAILGRHPATIGCERRGQIPARRSIWERPARVESRRRLGHWEADTLIGARRRAALLSVVERRSCYTRLGKLTRFSAEVFYNPKRHHSHLGGMSPEAFEGTLRRVSQVSTEPWEVQSAAKLPKEWGAPLHESNLPAI